MHRFETFPVYSVNLIILKSRCCKETCQMCMKNSKKFHFIFLKKISFIMCIETFLIFKCELFEPILYTTEIEIFPE